MGIMPPIPWSVDPDSHAAAITQYVRDTLELVCPKKETPRKEWVQQPTWEAYVRLRAKRAALRLAQR
eukprot:4789017-Alexandrium_andersonii.AAC.1